MAKSESDAGKRRGPDTSADDAIWKQAEKDHSIIVGPGRSDPVVWEHAARVARLAMQVAEFPEVASERFDATALLAAALYHDAGWVVQLRSGEVSRPEFLTRPTNDEQRDLGAAYLERQLAKLLPEPVLRIAAAAVRECNQRSAKRIEAQILAEAENLDDIGPQAVWPMVRRQIAEARGIEATLDAWHRQQEYHFWEARLKESFRFETSRQIARQRLAAMERFMSDLRRCHHLEDISDFLASAQRTPPTPRSQRSS